MLNNRIKYNYNKIIKMKREEYNVNKNRIIKIIINNK